MLTTSFDKLKVMTKNKNSKFLCKVGNEQNRVSIIIWTIENLDNITALLRRSVPTHINDIFSPFEENITMLGDYFTNKGKVYVGSNGGCIFQVTCNNQKLEVVYKVQDSAILTLALNKAFCATGSKNGILHIWPVYVS